MNEIEFIKMLLSSNNEIQLKTIYSSSTHKKKALQELNIILHEHPEYYPTVCVLASHNIQVWASEQRKHVNINFDTLTKDILMFDHLDEDEIESGTGKLNSQALTLKKTDAAMRYLEKIIDTSTLNGQIIASVHLDGVEVSKYLFSAHYYDAVIELCKLHNDEFKDILGGKMIEKYVTGEDDSNFAYHNGPALIKLFPKLVRRHALPDDLTRNIYLCLEQCLLRIKTAEDGENIYNILELCIRGVPEIKIAKKLGRSRNYVRSKISQGTELLSYIIWGYGTRAVMANISRINIQ